MNDNQFKKVMQDIREVLKIMELEVNDEFEKRHFYFLVPIRGTDTRHATFLTVLYHWLEKMVHLRLGISLVDIDVAVDKEREMITLESIISHRKKRDDLMSKVISLVNLFNRQPIIGHCFVHLNKTDFSVRKDISVDKGRLDKEELKCSIQALLDNMSSFYPLIRECMDSGDNANEQSNERLIRSSYLHKECRSD
jgi:hypothetical protein